MKVIVIHKDYQARKLVREWLYVRRLLELAPTMVQPGNLYAEGKFLTGLTHRYCDKEPTLERGVGKTTHSTD